MSETKHSPLPWHFGDYGSEIYSQGGNIIACVGDNEDMTESPESILDSNNAKLIVFRVNQGPKVDALLGIAEEMARTIEIRRAALGMNEPAFHGNLIDKAREFLKTKENL